MTEIKWIKISTDMFNDEKIKLIRKMPEGDGILLVWIYLLILAGKCNAAGHVFLSENVPYTDEMLSTVMDMPVNIIRLALETFKRLGMIEIDENNFIFIDNWEKHQNVEGMEKIKEQNRLRKRKQREREKQKALENSKCHVTSRDCHAIDLDIDKNIYIYIVEYLNEKTKKNFKYTTKKTKSLIDARLKEGFSLEDFKKVIDIKTEQWLNDKKMNSYLRPETLFGTKFEGYLNESTNPKNNGPDDDPYAGMKVYTGGE